MEINSLRWSGSFLHRENTRHVKVDRPTQQQFAPDQVVFEVPAISGPYINFSQITPRDLRQIALENYHKGNIDQDTYFTLAEELPTHAVDPTGQVLDLSDVTDVTGFNFQEYYSNQLQVASTIGDEQRASVLQSVLAFMKG
jgi:hypothetical protein